MTSSRKKNRAYVPLVVSVALIIGFVLGINIHSTHKENATLLIPTGRSNFNLLNSIVEYAENEYVDEVQKEELISKTAQFMLQELDPHSYYISAEELEAMNEPLEGNFDGIGIQFNIQKDTIVVVTPLIGGPSERVGIKAGDRIIKVDGETVAGVEISNREVISKLKGPKGTRVQVNIVRNSSEEELEFSITRDKIPIHSVDVGYMLDNETGYIKISRFAKNTYQEFMESGSELREAGMEYLILDLRGNGGGFLDAAVAITDEFLKEGQLIVYTEGRARAREEYRASSKSRFADVRVAVLLDESSASASEILAGAIQDNDRGVIIGRRSYGKGLVQEQTAWPDGSATRLTIARYYTPTGRSIQRPYAQGADSYHQAFYDRYHNGEMLSADSIDLPDSLRFETPGGKVVYGGGGIVPDVFVPIDTNGSSLYLNALSYAGLIYDFAFDYADHHRDELNAYGSWEAYDRSFRITGDMLQKLVGFAAQNGIEEDKNGLKRSQAIIERRLKAYIARNIWNSKGFYPIWNEEDVAVQRASEELKKGTLAEFPF
ncbi:MAG: PDZ domain-containing protein [Leptolyngbya sp. SIO3F4]|nr:PDZ domain-containing protein [Leptolyngbya sp. SIO3F4]